MAGGSPGGRRAASALPQQRLGRLDRMAEIQRQHRLGGALHAQRALVHPQHLAAPGGDDVGLMGRDHQDLGVAHQLLQPPPRLDHEAGVAGQEPLVHQQHLRPDRGGEREAEADHHAGAVGAHRHVEEAAEVGEPLHVVLQGADRARVQPGIEPAQADILPAGEVEVHPQVGVEQGVQLAPHRHPAGDRLVDPGQRAQQRGLARTVAADQPQPLARTQREGEAAQRVHHQAALRILAQPVRGRRGDGLAQRARGAVVQRERHVQVAHLDARHRLRPSTPGARARG